MSIYALVDLKCDGSNLHKDDADFTIAITPRTVTGRAATGVDYAGFLPKHLTWEQKWAIIYHHICEVTQGRFDIKRDQINVFISLANGNMDYRLAFILPSHVELSSIENLRLIPESKKK